jgi:hypothetical protein
MNGDVFFRVRHDIPWPEHRSTGVEMSSSLASTGRTSRRTSNPSVRVVPLIGARPFIRPQFLKDFSSPRRGGRHESQPAVTSHDMPS